MKRIRKFTISPFFFLMVIFFALAERSIFVAILLCSAFLHEAGHIAAVLHYRAVISELRIEPFGIAMTLRSDIPLSYRKDAAVALSGPAVNLLAAVILVCIQKLLPAPDSIIGFAILSNLGLLAVNLLPALPLDGGRALYALLLSAVSFKAAGRIMLAVNILVSALLAVGGIYLLIVTGYNISLLLIAVYLGLTMLIKNRSLCTA